MSIVKFTPTGDFFSEEFQSGYVKDLQYTVHEGNEKLDKAVKKWLEEGKVKILDPQAATDKATARMGGEGRVEGGAKAPTAPTIE